MDNDKTIPSYTEHFAKFVVDSKYEDVNPEYLALAKECLLDLVGVKLVASTLPWNRLVYDYACEIGSFGDMTAVGMPKTLNMLEAAFVNATYAQGCELDDYGHAGAATIPTALAVAEHIGASGRDLLHSIAVGYEIFFRLADAMMPQIHDRGFHQQCVLAVFSSAAVAGKLLGLSEEQMVHAFGIAGSHASGTAEYDQSGGEVKRVHAGLGARGGIQSALLARRGLTGPRTILEGKRGILRTFVDYAREENIVSNLGPGFSYAPNVAFKLYPAVGSIHTAIGAFDNLVSEHGLRDEDIREIRVGLPEFVLLHGAGIVVPDDVLSAQFSLAFSLAMRMVCGRNDDLGLYMEEKLWSDPRILSLAHKVKPYADPAAEGVREKRFGSLVTIELIDGRVVEEYQQYRRGHPLNPLHEGELESKFRTLSASVLNEDEIEKLAASIYSLEKAENLDELVEPLRR